MSEQIEIKRGNNSILIYNCNGDCERRNMIGRSWWKSEGYHTSCRCAYNSAMKYYNEEERDEFFHNLDKHNFAYGIKPTIIKTIEFQDVV